MNAHFLLLQICLPLPFAIFAPRLLLHVTLEMDVIRGLCCSVVCIASIMIIFSIRLSNIRAKVNAKSGIRRAYEGSIGFVGGILFWHILIVLFGAPFSELFLRTLLLSILMSAFTALPLAVHFGLDMQEWIQIVLNWNWRREMHLLYASKSIMHEVFLQVYASISCLGAIAGIYFGAFPIPLDWDRPWQQWPLTCVYGCLSGNAISLFALYLWLLIQRYLHAPKHTETFANSEKSE